MSRYLHHVTLTTGHTRRSWRHEIAPGLIPMLRDLITSAREETGALIPGTDLWLTITDTSRCALCSVRTSDDVPVIVFAVADHARCGAQLWEMLIAHARIPCVSGLADRPPTPWCAVRLDLGAALLTEDVARMLGDMERCIAWAWLEGRPWPVIDEDDDAA